MSIEEIIAVLSADYGVRPNTLRKYYEMLKEYPIFQEEDAMECLSIICEERIPIVTIAEEKFISDVTGLPTQKFRIRYKLIKDIIENTLRDVYPEYGDEVEKIAMSPIMYDEAEYDVMERDDQLDYLIDKYYDEADDIRMKARAAHEKTKKKNNTQK